jgi:opacity protein-like surface antigen
MFNWAASIVVITAGLLDSIGPVHAFTPGGGALADQRILSDPTYLPSAHEISGTTSYSYASGSLSTFLLSGTEINHQTLQTSAVVQTVEWGVTDDLTLRLSDDYVDEKTTVHFPGTSYSFVVGASGATNPTLGGVYRVIDQFSTFPLSVDIVGSYSPDLIRNRVANVAQHGSAGSGRQAFTTGLALGRFMPQFTIRGSLEAAHEGRGDASEITSGDEQQTAHWNYAIGIGGQVRVTDRWSVDAGFRYTTLGSEITTYHVPAADYSGRADAGKISDLSVGLNYHIIRNKLVAQVAYDYFRFGRRTTNFTNLPGARVIFIDYYIDDRHANEVTARLYYAF